MSVPTPTQFETTPVRVVFRPYAHDDVQILLRRAVKEFGRPGARWTYRSPSDVSETFDNNVWVLDFYFANGHDRTLFALKYQL